MCAKVVFSVAALALAMLLYPIALPPKFHVPAPGAILVTGAGSGIGRNTALKLAQQLPEHNVFGLVRKEEDSKDLQEASHGRVHAIVADLTDPEALKAAIRSLRERLNQDGTSLVGFFDSAGLPVPNAPVEFLDLDVMRRIYEVDVFGLVAVLQLVLPLLRESQGRICLMGSVTGAVTPSFMAADPARVIEVVADAMRREVLAAGVAVSVVQSGFVRSPIINKTEAKDHELLESARGQEMLQAYPKLSAKSYETQMPQSQMPPMDTVSEVVLHALTSPRPRMRYVIGAVPSPVPTKLLVPLMHFLPHQIIDLFE